MERVYDKLLSAHFGDNRQMAFLSGPRQVGKTTSSQTGGQKNIYLNWDNQRVRQRIMAGPDSVVEQYGLNTLEAKLSRVIFDEIHKYSKWKSFLKGYFDDYGEGLNSVVTGSARLNVYKRGGDSLMGRYFLYRMHPLSVAEISSAELPESEIRSPTPVSEDILTQLLTFGGFPEPLLKTDPRFYNRWRRLRSEQLFYEDLRDITNIQEISQIEVMAELLRHQAGQVANLSRLANEVNISVDTVRRWLAVLEALYYCYSVRPWFNNIPKSLRKRPKIYMWDWSLAVTPGSRVENLVASHLNKAVHLWTDMGFGDFSLHYLRDKQQREVDFAVIRNGAPWFIVEVKSSKRRISPSLDYFQKTTGAAHAFQLEWNTPYIDADCFDTKGPIAVPAATFLSQLV